LWSCKHPPTVHSAIEDRGNGYIQSTATQGRWLSLCRGCDHCSCMRVWGVLLLVLGSLVPMGGILGSAAAPAHHHRHFESFTFNSSLGLTYKPPIVFPALQTHTASVLCLHGLARPHKGLLCRVINTDCACIALCARSRPPFPRSLPARAHAVGVGRDVARESGGCRLVNELCYRCLAAQTLFSSPAEQDTGSPPRQESD